MIEQDIIVVRVKVDILAQMKKFVLFDFLRKYVILMTKRLKSWLNYVRAEFAEYKY